jgi:hypothetical protein
MGDTESRSSQSLALVPYQGPKQGLRAASISFPGGWSNAQQALATPAHGGLLVKDSTSWNGFSTIPYKFPARGQPSGIFADPGYGRSLAPEKRDAFWMSVLNTPTAFAPSVVSAALSAAKARAKSVEIADKLRYRMNYGKSSSITGDVGERAKALQDALIKMDPLYASRNMELRRSGVGVSSFSNSFGGNFLQQYVV